MIPFERRGMYQAAQNCLIGFGAVCGASLGGAIADSFGWRWCFLAQVPFSILALVVGYIVLEDPLGDMFYLGEKASLRFALTHVDVLGSAVLVVALLVQLLALSLGGNQLPWGSPWVLGALAASIILLGIFGVVEATTKTIPIIPLRMLRGRLPVFTQITNVFSGMAAYAFIFMLPLFFQVVVMDTPSKAGMRLMIPSLSTPMGGLIAGYTMSKCGRLARLIRIGTLLMTVGNLLLVLLDFENASWKYLLFLFPANLGLGMMNPSVLFSFISAFEHREQAVATSLVYLIRSLGNIWGVTITSSIVQNVLSTRLPEALKDIRHSDRVIDEIRHSVFALRGLPPTVQLAARHVYFEAIGIAFIASTCFAAISFLASLFANAKSLERAPVQWVGEEEAA
ncbi:Plasma membrane iron permease [Venturia inaequalis]|nr:Plasma membrane iron permease [Venturia inaequalis]